VRHADDRRGRFEWDAAKARANARKHGVTFEEATTVFDDPHALDAPDRYDPERFVIIGVSSRSRLLFAASTAQRRIYEEES